MAKIHTATTSAVKRFNKSLIFRAIRESERISQQDIATRLGLSVPTVLQNVRELLDAGLVREEGEFQSTGGRKAKAFALVPDARHSLGVDVTESGVEMVAVDLAGRTVSHKRFPLRFSTSDKFFVKMADLIRRFADDCGIPDSNVLGVGFSVPGIVNTSGETIEYSHILRITNVATENFSRSVPHLCTFLNDANAAGLAEFFNRGDLRNAAYLSLSPSVGGALLIGGELYLGENRRSGEFGHQALYPNGRECYCGKKGCLDVYCSSKVLARETGDNLDLFFEKLRGGDKHCRKAWEEYLGNLAVAINGIRMVFDCEVVVGGYVGGHLDGLVGELRDRLAELNTFERDGSYVRACCYRIGASAAGAALQHISAFAADPDGSDEAAARSAACRPGMAPVA